MEINKELDELRGKTLAHGFVLQRLLMLAPLELRQYLPLELARMEAHPRYAELETEPVREAIRSEIETLLAPPDTQGVRIVPEE